MSEYERLLAEAQGGAQGGAVAGDPPTIRSVGGGDESDRDDWKDAAKGAVNGAVKGAVTEGGEDGESGESGEGGSEGSAGDALGHDGPGISEELPDEFEFRYVAHRGQTRSGTWYESNGLLGTEGRPEAVRWRWY